LLVRWRIYLLYHDLGCLLLSGVDPAYHLLGVVSAALVRLLVRPRIDEAVEFVLLRGAMLIFELDASFGVVVDSGAQMSKTAGLDL